VLLARQRVGDPKFPKDVTATIEDPIVGITDKEKFQPKLLCVPAIGVFALQEKNLLDLCREGRRIAAPDPRSPEDRI
jgi:hypothetical protein